MANPESFPGEENVLYIDEYRKAKWLAELKRARRTGQMALFGAELTDPGQLILFPTPESPENPDPAA